MTRRSMSGTRHQRTLRFCQEHGTSIHVRCELDGEYRTRQMAELPPWAFEFYVSRFAKEKKEPGDWLLRGVW